LASLIGANRNSTAAECNVRDEIALVESATVGWTRVFYSMLETKETELMATKTMIHIVLNPTDWS
jgi:hypothetical protein